MSGQNEKKWWYNIWCRGQTPYIKQLKRAQARLVWGNVSAGLQGRGEGGTNMLWQIRGNWAKWECALSDSNRRNATLYLCHPPLAPGLCQQQLCILYSRSACFFLHTPTKLQCTGDEMYVELWEELSTWSDTRTLFKIRSDRSCHCNKHTFPMFCQWLQSEKAHSTENLQMLPRPFFWCSAIECLCVVTSQSPDCLSWKVALMDRHPNSGSN